MAFHLTDQAMGGQGDDDQPLGQQSSEGNDVHDTTMTNSSGCSEVATSPSPPLSEGAPAKEVRKNNVSELVAKSKKAASSLWTLLHAKNCRMGVNRCSHAGCAEAKLMYLHLKTCSAELLEPCPSSHPGCQDSRKLLAHYRRCRDIRARQAQNPAAKSQHHVCLVCSLVARHAKFTLDRKCVSPKAGASSHYIPSLNLSYESNGKNGGSFERGKPSAQPRFAFSRPTSNGSSGFQALQAAVTCALNSKPASSSPLDPISENSTRTGRCGLDKNYYHRPRAESLDVRGSSVTQLQSKGEKNMSYLYLAAVESLEEEPTPSHSRRRSQSCSVPSASSASAVDDCDPIMDKPIGEELQCILGGDS